MAELNLSAVEGASVSRIPSSASISGGFTSGTSSGCFRKDGTVLTELAAMDGRPDSQPFALLFLSPKLDYSVAMLKRLQRALWKTRGQWVVQSDSFSPLFTFRGRCVGL